MATFTITRKLNISANEAWAIISNFIRPPSPAIKIEVEEEGDPKKHGIGAIRKITIGRVRARERLETVNSPHSFTYRVLSGAPVKSYVGTVKTIARDGTTELQWTVEFIPKIPGIGWLVSRVSKRAINRFIDEIEAGTR